MPIGIENPYIRSSTLLQLARQVSTPRPILLYMNFTKSTSLDERSLVFQIFEDKPFCTKVQRKPFEEYLADLGRTTFVLSPRGNGLDTHRTWEALYMGAYPIVKKSTLDSLFDGLPVVIVDDWNEITEEFLTAKAVEMGKNTWKMERLFMPHWLDLMRSAAIY